MKDPGTRRHGNTQRVTERPWSADHPEDFDRQSAGNDPVGDGEFLPQNERRRILGEATEEKSGDANDELDNADFLDEYLP